jgi:hypothetical protein
VIEHFVDFHGLREFAHRVGAWLRSGRCAEHHGAAEDACDYGGNGSTSSVNDHRLPSHRNSEYLREHIARRRETLSVVDAERNTTIGQHPQHRPRVSADGAGCLPLPRGGGPRPVRPILKAVRMKWRV